MSDPDLHKSDTLPDPEPAGAGLFGDPEPPVAVAPAPYRVLARAYRPVKFDELIGQDAMVRILRRAFELGRVAHGFMLTGVRGTGKTTTARIIARALNCIGPDGNGGPTADPCGVCANCVAILADRHPDVLEMDAASHTGVDDIREIIEVTRYRPIQARMKVFIIDEVHMLSRNAFNALLKTLEEPPAQVTFIFATTELRRVPVTVLSRCQRYDLRRVSQSELATHFGRIAGREGASIDTDALAIIARAADGSVRDGLSLLDQAISLGEGGGGAGAGGDGPSMIDGAMVADMLGQADRGLVFDLLEAVMAGHTATALSLSETAYQRGADPGLVLSDLLELLHTLSRLKALPALRESRELPEVERVRGVALADRLGMAVLGRAWQMLLKGVAEIEQAPNRQDAADMVLIRLCHVHDMPTPGELVRRLNEAGPAASPVVPDPVRPPPAAEPGGGVLRLPGGPSAGAMSAHALSQPVPAPAADLPPTPDPDPAPSLRSWREVVAYVATRREPSLHGHLRHCVHLVRFAAPVIEIRCEPEAPRDLTQRLGAILLQGTGTRWTIAISRERGEPTLAEQSGEVEAKGRTAAESHPLVQAILDAFPGARIGALRDTRLDEYGLLPETPALLDDAQADFTPLGAEPPGPGEFTFEPDDIPEND
ncbi:DNA polymerase III subunit gamma/tau [Lichenicoccus roseus]|uniref:DNA polymerase III subunit gamma/tau n=1 Tax=Lichenicoccus roseus TaxID=2683649 RepID=UPI001F0F9EAE|nr:DNA polymerase III subunit gamma/tau [Lichenicoccus roseus]